MADKLKVYVYGLIKEVEFQLAKGAAEYLYGKDQNVFDEPYTRGMLECDWIDFVEEKKKEIKGEVWSFKDNCMVFVNSECIGGTEAFIKWATDNHQFREFRPLPLYYALTKESYKSYLLETKDDYVFMDIAIGDSKPSRILIQLYSNMCPRTCENFRELCVGEKEETVRHEPPIKLAYKNSIIHRIVPNGWIQAGDFDGGRGSGGESIFGITFEDENFAIPHNRRGVIGMANKGRHTNGSQFYITLQPAPWMDTKYVAFGQIIEGLELLDKLESEDTFNERPKTECKIVNCGVFDVDALYQV